MLSNPLGKPPLGFLPLDPIGSELTESRTTPTVRNMRLDSSRSLLYSRSSSPSDSDTSGFSSGSDHLSDLIVSFLCFCWEGRGGWGGGRPPSWPEATGWLMVLCALIPSPPLKSLSNGEMLKQLKRNGLLFLHVSRLKQSLLAKALLPSEQ